MGMIETENTKSKSEKILERILWDQPGGSFADEDFSPAARQAAALLDSLVGALSTAVDECSPYNASHTRNMVIMADAFLDWLEETGNPWAFSPQKRRAFLMSVWLHDVGKLAISPAVMDKPSRLGLELEIVKKRFRTMGLLDRIRLLEGKITEQDYQQRKEMRDKKLAFILKINTAGYLTDEDLVKVERLGRETYIDEEGREKTVLKMSEIEELSIRQGTLTSQEREVMQSHVVITGRILAQVDFPEGFKEVPLWAGGHHELLSGRGYPNHLSGDAIPKETRLLTILDIFEALTAKERPYKSAVPLEVTKSIMRNMVQDGDLDGELLDLFEQSRAWEALEETDRENE